MNGRNPFNRLRCFFYGAAAWLLFPSAAFAQVAIARPSSAFSSVDKTDLARAWIDYIFHGEALPPNMAALAAPFAAAADGLRQALGLYSLGMLMVAALLVFYHIAAMVAETAHHGMPLGRRANPVWMPIRFVLAIGLLVPVSGSLNAGQYLVIKIAGEGSALASNAWREIASVGGERLSGIVAPRGPDVAQTVEATVEMETCRLVYQQTYSSMQEDPIIRMAGNIGSDVVKIPAGRFSSEIWRSSNILNATAPLCGELRFSGFRNRGFTATPASENIALMANHLSAFAHEQADDLIARARIVATRAAPVFLGTATPTGADIQNDLATINGIYRSRLDTEKQAIINTAPHIAASVLQNSVDAGWIDAAHFVMEIVRLQESTSALFDHALPAAQEPVFVHPTVARQLLVETLDTLPTFHPLDQEGFGKLATFYGQVGRVMAQMHGWMENSQIPEKDFVPPSGFDLRDRLNAGTDPAAAFSLYANALDAGALERGVWGVSPDSNDAGYPFAPIAAAESYNPFAALAEFGQRQVDLATSLTGYAGGGITSPNTAGAAALLGLVGIALLAGGLMLIFIVPLLPFLRFLLGVLTWAISVFEGVAAIPLVALAHLTPSGEGLSGGMARQAYMLWLGIFVRPVLTLFGFALGLLLFTLSLAFLNAALTPFAQLAAPSNDGLLTLANTGLVLLYDILVYAAVNACFKGIHWLPDRGLNWLSRFVMTDGGDMAVPATAAGGPSGGGPNVYVSSASSAMGGTAFGTSSTFGTSVPGTSAAAQKHAAATALFPAYQEKPAPPVVPPVAPTVTPGAGLPGTPTVKATFVDPKKPIKTALRQQPDIDPARKKDLETRLGKDEEKKPEEKKDGGGDIEPKPGDKTD